MIFKSPFPDVDIPEVSLPQFILDRTANMGDKAALIDGPTGRTITFEGLAQAMKLVAASLYQRGFKKGDVLAICSPNVPEYAVAFHAVAMLGGIVTTANPLYTTEELTHQFNDANAIYLVTIPMFMDKAQEAAKASSIKEIFVFGEAEGATPFASLLQSDGIVPDVEINPKEDLVVLPYSSGTTGLPKGVMLTHYNLVANICQCIGVPSDGSIREGDVLLGVLPFFHIYGMVVIMNYALAEKATIVTMPRFDLEQFLQLIEKHQISYAHLVPPIILALAKHPLIDKYPPKSLRYVFSGAAPLGGEVAQECRERLAAFGSNVTVTQGYGMTELSPVSHMNPDSPDIIDAASIGPAIPNIECKFVDIETGAELGVNETGELWVRGPNRMIGYLNNAEATAHTIDADGWLHTGDVGHVDDKGYFYIVDRVKELIKYKGFQVAPAELEALLLTHPAIADAAVIPSIDDEGEEVPKGYVVFKAEQEISQEDVYEFVASKVAPHKKLRKLEFVESIPKSASGKILRRLLVAEDRAQA